MTTPGNGYNPDDGPDPQFQGWLQRQIQDYLSPIVQRMSELIERLERREQALATDSEAIAQKAAALAQAKIQAEIQAEVNSARNHVEATTTTAVATREPPQNTTPAKTSIMDWLLSMAQTPMGQAFGQRLVDRFMAPPPTNDLDLFLGLLERRPILQNLVPSVDPTQAVLKAGVDSFVTGLKAKAMAAPLVAGPTAPLVEAILPKDSGESSDVLSVQQNQPPKRATPEMIRQAAALIGHQR